MPKRMHITGVRDDEPFDFDVDLVDRLYARRLQRQDDAFKARLSAAIEGGWETMPTVSPEEERPHDTITTRISPSIVPDHPPIPEQCNTPGECINATLGIAVVKRRQIRAIRIWPGDDWYVNVSLPRISMQEADLASV